MAGKKARASSSSRNDRESDEEDVSISSEVEVVDERRQVEAVLDALSAQELNELQALLYGDAQLPEEPEENVKAKKHRKECAEMFYIIQSSDNKTSFLKKRAARGEKMARRAVQKFTKIVRDIQESKPNITAGLVYQIIKLSFKSYAAILCTFRCSLWGGSLGPAYRACVKYGSNGGESDVERFRIGANLARRVLRASLGVRRPGQTAYLVDQLGGIISYLDEILDQGLTPVKEGLVTLESAESAARHALREAIGAPTILEEYGGAREFQKTLVTYGKSTAYATYAKEQERVANMHVSAWLAQETIEKAKRAGNPNANKDKNKKKKARNPQR